MDVTVKDLPALRVASVRHVGPYCDAKVAWERLMAWAGPRGIFGPTTRLLGLCHDDPEATPPEKIRYDACLTVGPSVEADGDVEIREVRGGPYAIARHEGPYETLDRTYAGLVGTWLPRSGHEAVPTSPCVEFYLNDPGSTPPAALLTDVCVPLAR